MRILYIFQRRLLADVRFVDIFFLSLCFAFSSPLTVPLKEHEFAILTKPSFSICSSTDRVIDVVSDTAWPGPESGKSSPVISRGSCLVCLSLLRDPAASLSGAWCVKNHCLVSSVCVFAVVWGQKATCDSPAELLRQV